MKMTVADYIASFLAERSITHVFGYQGSAVTKILDAIVSAGKIRYIQNFHEQGSAFCADGHARISGNIGVALATSGPGATNLITGIANAQFDSVPALFITGQDYSTRIKKPTGVRLNGFQDLDIVSVVHPLTKYAVQLSRPEDVRRVFEKAFREATSGRPGAVLVDVPIDVQFAKVDAECLEGDAEETMQPKIATEQKRKFLELLSDAHQPIALIGGGVRLSGAGPALKEFLKKSGIPAVATLNGLDSGISCTGLAGLYGNSHSNLAVYHSDLLLVCGARLGQQHIGKIRERYTKAKIVHVDIDPLELGRAAEETLSICGDLKTFFEEINPLLPPTDFSAWSKQISAWEKEYGGNVDLLPESGLVPTAFLRDLYAAAANAAVFVGDVGQNQMWLAQTFDSSRNLRLLNSSGLGSMGYALPAAVGAAFAAPGRQIVCVTGDGGFQMNMQELGVISLHGVPVKCVVMNNGTLGLIREVQVRYYHSHFYGTREEDFRCVDPEKIATAYGLKYLRIESGYDASALKNALEDESPWIIDVRLNPKSKLLNRYDDPAIITEAAE